MPACCPAFNVFCTKEKCSLPARKHGIDHPLVGTLRLRIGPDHLLSMSAVQAARLHNPTYFNMIEHTCIILDVLLRLSFSLFVLTTLPTNICRSQLLLYSVSPCDRMQVLCLGLESKTHLSQISVFKPIRSYQQQLELA